MNTVVLLIFIQICSLQIIFKSFGVIVVNSSRSHHRYQSQDKHISKNDKTLQKNKNDDTGNHKRKDVFQNDFFSDGQGKFIDSLNTYNEFGRDHESYPPNSNTFMYDNNDRSEQKGTRHDPDGVHFNSNGDGHRKGNIVTGNIYGSFSDSDSEASFNVGAVNNKGMDNYNDDTFCPEKCLCEGTQVMCVGKDLTSVPEGINRLTTSIDLSMNSIQALSDDSFSHLPNLKELDLSMNNIQRLYDNSFAHLPYLKELRCVGNNLTDLPHRLFKHNQFLQLLHFQGNLFQNVPARTFQNLNYLLELHLDANEITTIPKHAFAGLSNLKHLWLDDNKLESVPTKSFRALTVLEALTLIKNKITHLPDYAFRNNTKLIHLRLANNEINNIADKAFYGLTKLKYLQLQHNKIKAVPSAFSHLVSLEELNLKDNLLTQISDKNFVMKNKLTTLELGNNPITYVAKEAFKNLPSLKEIKLLFAHDTYDFPDLRGSGNLVSFQLERARITSIPEDLCDHVKNLERFGMHSSKIEALPKMSKCKNLTNLDMSKNVLTTIEGQLFDGMDNLKDLTLNLNFIRSITENTFVGLSALEYLDLSGNQIKELHPNAFLPLKSLKNLNLGENKFQRLPTAGLISLETLKVFNMPELQEFPPKEEFPKVTYFAMAYAYHCCDFIQSKSQESGETVKELEFLDDPNALPGHINFTTNILDFFENITIDVDHWDSISEKSIAHFESLDRTRYQVDSAGYEYLEDNLNHAFNKHKYSKPGISCKPLPGPFQPCDDLFDWWSLRCGVWFVFILALFGNGAVFFVSVTSKSKMDVTRFLICNLAVADFFMGIYLGILATMDASTFGSFRKVGIAWQRSTGCRVAGTLGVLSSELSVFTLTVITLERFYAITHAMQLNKRLSLKHAGFIMLCGWIWSFGLAILPLFGISDYRKFAVCLPFEIQDPISKSYVCFLMVFNGVSFFIILACYLTMYISIRRSQTWNSNDTRVAKRMALLVFTDLLCWAPIALLSLAAAFGKNLIQLNEAKVLTIFILPLNSCANPFLYAFFTKQFKKDCMFLCWRLQHSVLAKHFSQTSQRNVSLSWKYNQHPSTLQSLVGESKINNSHNNSSGSNSFGLHNYNSEISSGPSKTVGQEAMKFDEYNTASQAYSTSSSEDVSNNRMYHKYTPCPSSENEDDIKIMNNTFSDVHRCDDDYYVQVTRDQNVSHRRWTARDGHFSETHISDDYDDYTFSPDDDLHDDKMVKAYRHQKFTRAVIQENEHVTRAKERIKHNTPQQHSTAELMDSSHYGENEVYINIKQFNQISHPQNWQVNGLHTNSKDIKIINPNNESCSLGKSHEGNNLESNICKEICDLNPKKCSMAKANKVCYDHNNGKIQKTTSA